MKKETNVGLTDDQLALVVGRVDENTVLVCPYCGSTDITPYHSPKKGTLYLCSNCYRSFNKKDK